MGNARYEILKAGGDKAEYLELIAAKESSMNPNAKNPTKGASASGLFQFTKGTWKSMVEQMGKDYDLADRFDPAKATEVALYLTNENEKYLKNKLGRDVTMTELYTAHVMGAPRGVDFIQGHNMAPDTEAAKYFEKESEWNKALFFNKDGSQKSFKQVNKWFTLDTPKNETLEQKQQRARDIRNSTRTIVPEMNEASHLMGYSEDDGKYYAHPTLFPRKQGDEPYAVEDWIQPEKSFDEAKKRGELFEFETEQEAIDFAAGSWKLENQEEQATQDKAIQDIKSNQFLLDLIKGTDAKFQAKGQMRSTPIYEDGGEVGDPVVPKFISSTIKSSHADMQTLMQDAGFYQDGEIDGLWEEKSIRAYGEYLKSKMPPPRKEISYTDINYEDVMDNAYQSSGKDWESSTGYKADGKIDQAYHGFNYEGKDYKLTTGEFNNLKRSGTMRFEYGGELKAPFNSLNQRKNVQQRIYNTVSPSGYSTDPVAIAAEAKRFILNDTDAADNFPKVDREIFGYALGVVPKEKLEYWEETPYRPEGAEENETYLRFRRDKINSGLISSMIEEHQEEGNPRNLSNSPAMPFIDSPEYYDPLAKYEKGLGKDKQGKYFYIKDKWDLNNPIANAMLENKPIIYDKFYYGDNPEYTKNKSKIEEVEKLAMEARDFSTKLHKMENKTLDNGEYTKEFKKALEKSDKLHKNVKLKEKEYNIEGISKFKLQQELKK